MDKKCRIISDVLAVTAAAAAVNLFIFSPGHATRKQKAPFMGRNIAHRGLHSMDKTVPENSLEAFRLAAETGYGAELDVRLTKDGQVVVCHDDSLMRVCGVDKKVSELNYEELSNYPIHGTSQTVPLFADVLKVIDGRGPVICEVKDMGKKNRELCRKTYDIICGYKGDICIESFNPFVVTWFRFHARELLRGQLAMPVNGYDSFPKGLALLLSGCFFNVMARPHFIAYKIGKKPLSVRLSEALGAMKVCWTSHDAANENKRDCVIFEFYRPGLKFK